MRGLPEEFHGVRSPDEVLHDLQAIADADGWLSLVSAAVWTPGERAASYDGPLRLQQGPAEVVVIVGEKRVASFRPDALRGGWLGTNDGDEYFVLSVDTGEKLITLSD